MMSQLKNIFAFVAIAGSISFATTLPAQAQNTKTQPSPKVQKQSDPYQRNLKEINAFNKTTDTKALMGIISNIQNNMQEEIAQTKREVMIAAEQENQSKASDAGKRIAQLGTIYNKIVKASRSAESLDKAAIATALKEYQKLH